MTYENKSLEDIFDLIHRKQAEKLLALLDDDDREITPQELNAITKFLSDNNITGVRGGNSGLKKLSDGFEAFQSGYVAPTRTPQ